MQEVSDTYDELWTLFLVAGEKGSTYFSQHDYNQLNDIINIILKSMHLPFAGPGP